MKIKTRLWKYFFWVLIAIFMASLSQTPAIAGTKGVIESLFNVYIGERRVTVPFYLSLTVWEKKPGKVTYKRVKTMGKVPKLPTEIIKSNLDRFKGEPLMYWYPEMGTLPEIPAGEGAEIVIEHNLYFAGVENYIQAAMSPDGGKTLYLAERQENKSWTVNLDGAKMPPGARAFSWYLRHKDDKTFIVIFIIKLTSNAEGIASGGIFIGCRALPPEVRPYFSRLSTRAKRTFFEGMRSAEADCTNMKKVQNEIRKIVREDAEKAQTKLQVEQKQLLPPPLPSKPTKKFSVRFENYSNRAANLWLKFKDERRYSNIIVRSGYYNRKSFPQGKFYIYNKSTGESSGPFVPRILFTMHH